MSVTAQPGALPTPVVRPPDVRNAHAIVLLAPPGASSPAICHNLLRAAGTLTSSRRYNVARGATLRTHLINIPARLARPQRRPVLPLPAHWPRTHAWLTHWQAVFTT